MIKLLFKGLLFGVAFEAGCNAFNKLKRPETRAKIKNKFKKIKDIITDKQN